MYTRVLVSAVELFFSVNSLVIIIGYLVVCHLLISRARELMFSVVLQCFWAVSFVFLFCAVFFVGSPEHALVASCWPIMVSVLLALSIVPACMVKTLTRRSVFPSLIGLLEVFWFVGVSQVIVWQEGLVIIPPIDMVIVVVAFALVVTSMLGALLTTLSHAHAVASGRRGGTPLFTRLAGVLTVYVPLCLYGGCIRVLFGSE